MTFMDSFLNNVQVAVGGFHTPEVLKRNDEGIQKQIAYYELNPTEENKKKLAGFKKGAEGEANVLFQLEHSGIGMYILQRPKRRNNNNSEWKIQKKPRISVCSKPKTYGSRQTTLAE